MTKEQFALEVLSALPAKNRRKALTHKAPYFTGGEWSGRGAN